MSNSIMVVAPLMPAWVHGGCHGGDALSTRKWTSALVRSAAVSPSRAGNNAPLWRCCFRTCPGRLMTYENRAHGSLCGIAMDRLLGPTARASGRRSTEAARQDTVPTPVGTRGPPAQERPGLADSSPLPGLNYLRRRGARTPYLSLAAQSAWCSMPSPRGRRSQSRNRPCACREASGAIMPHVWCADAPRCNCAQTCFQFGNRGRQTKNPCAGRRSGPEPARYRILGSFSSSRTAGITQISGHRRTSMGPTGDSGARRSRLLRVPQQRDRLAVVFARRPRFVADPT
jgi:hypothetical protein